MKIVITLAMLCALWLNAMAQTPRKMSYQAVIRDAGGNLVTNKQVGMRITILEGALPGTTVYQEIQRPATNANGLVTIEIGGGTGFDTIHWENGLHFIKTETDPAGSTNYTISGTSQLLSVPYALYAGKSGDNPWKWKGDDISFQGGKVGIGTEKFLGKLDVRGDDSLRVIFSSAAGANSLTSGIMMRSTFGGDIPDYEPRNLALIKAHFDGGGWDKATLGFHVAGVDCMTDGDSEPCERMRITSQGNVGIGTKEPVEKLEVNGNVDIHNHTLMNLANPVNEQDAATKAYVDAIKETIYNELLDAGLNGTVKDVDNNTYKTIKIGTQVWMAENLKTIKYSDGSPIPLAMDNTEWENLTTGGYCYYNDDPSFKIIYGALYNWYAVSTGKLCPAGWHVPSDAEWTTLTNYLTDNGYGYQGSGDDIAKSMASATLWDYSSTPGTPGNDPVSNNSSGFSGLPVSYRYGNGTFNYVGCYVYWWSSTENSTTGAWYRLLGCTIPYVYRNYLLKGYGFSVRCVRD